MRIRRLGLCLAALALVMASVSPVQGSAVTGSAGIDTSIAPTDSAVTASGRGLFSDLKVTVNQTKNLLNQAISVTWKGGAPTIQAPALFSGNYVQIFECWGDPDGTNPANPGPDPQKCAFGARNGTIEHNKFPVPPGSFATDRIISRQSWQNYDAAIGVTAPQSGDQWLPFKAVKGQTVGVGVDYNFNPSVEGGQYWENPFFNIVTTNEIPGALTLDNGTGAELFEVQTGIENAGLGCGQSVEPVATGGTKVPQCWLVVVPRGAPRSENANTPYEASAADTFGVMTSPLSPSIWKNRIAIPLGFNPVDSSCSLAEDAARLAGTELAQTAISSWQPALCTKPGLRPYAYGDVPDPAARQLLVAGGDSAPGMVVVNRPIDAGQADPASPVVYAPLTLSGLTIGFNVERRPSLEADSDAQKLANIRIANINLTPRLVAKLLTQSYKHQLLIIQQAPYNWLKTNPDFLGQDPDFLAFNPEFKEQDVVNRRTFSGLVVPGGLSDAAQALWNYVLADPEAKKWLAGEPDPWGMVVNPVYSTDGSKNPTGAPFGDPAPLSFPKSDPYCFQEKPLGPQQIVPPPLCGTDDMPYGQSFHDVAHSERAADDGAKLSENSNPLSTSDVWQRLGPQVISTAMLGVADTPSANLFGLQTARLSRAGDDAASRTFIAPNQQSLTAAVGGMSAKTEPAVLEPDPTANVPGAYPLTLLSYAAIKPLQLSDAQRQEYAAFLSYGVSDGQVPGLEFGQLPVGYAPLPDFLKTQALAAAKTIVELKAPAVAQGGSGTSGSIDVPSPPISSGSLPSSSGSLPTPPDLSSGLPSPSDAATVTSPGAALPATGTSSPLKRVLTPAVATPVTRFGIPALAALALLAALGFLEITKRPRRSVRP